MTGLQRWRLAPSHCPRPDVPGQEPGLSIKWTVRGPVGQAHPLFCDALLLLIGPEEEFTSAVTPWVIRSEPR